jgi:CheY-like chemotaxis protein
VAVAPAAGSPDLLDIRVDVEDTGPGLPTERAARVFDDFVQGDASLSRAHGGTGLGLGIARQMARRMGGDVTLRSVAGEGSVFTLSLRLPLAADPAPCADPAPGHAWLIYSEPTVGSWLQRRLLRLGWTSELVADSATAATCAGSLDVAARPALVVVSEHSLSDHADLAALRAALPAAHIRLLIRPDWNQPELEQRARALDMVFDVMPLTPRDLRLMLAQHRPALPMPNVAPAPAPGHVLVVEDNAVNRMIAEEFLRTLGISTRTAEDGAQALAACAADTPRLVLMDLQMPVMDGLAATRVLRERQQRGELPDFPIVALTAHAMSADAEACRAAGMVACLTKPLLLDALRAELLRWWPELTPD